ncbi:hypothetical protein E2C01_082277 [Portunus trituberculatus]|uniref:Uncharacterized protein n=1 Tax=Portunus trituberculatus TaxID=210409 RepID=A0A5B7J0E2_PORTR|nr:hypothetical protein [Portunus trituberculatus]
MLVDTGVKGTGKTGAADSDGSGGPLTVCQSINFEGQAGCVRGRERVNTKVVYSKLTLFSLTTSPLHFPQAASHHPRQVFGGWAEVAN